MAKTENTMAAVIPLKGAKARKDKEVEPYEPTAREAEVLASHERRKAQESPLPA